MGEKWTKEDKYVNDTMDKINYNELIDVVIKSRTGEKLSIIGKLISVRNQYIVYDFEMEILKFEPKEHYLIDQLNVYSKLEDTTKRYCRIRNHMVDKIYDDYGRWLKLKRIKKIVEDKKKVGS